MIGVSRQRVAQIVDEDDDFPAPEAELASGRVWDRTAVETWIHNRRRDDEDAARRELAGARPGIRAAVRANTKGTFAPFTDRARRVVALAQQEARLLSHSSIDVNHVLLGLVHEAEGLAGQVLIGRGSSLETLRARARELRRSEMDAPVGRIPFTADAKKAFDLSLREALQLGHNYVSTEHMLLGIVRMGSLELLKQCGVPTRDLRAAVIDAMSNPRPPTANAPARDERARILEELERIRLQLAALESLVRGTK